MSLPYFPMYPSDFEAKTSYLTLAEDGAHNRSKGAKTLNEWGGRGDE